MTRTGPRSLTGAVVALALLTAACGNGSSAGTDDDLVSSGPVEQYFDALASGQRDRGAEMLDASEPGSPAHTFARHRAALDEASAAAGLDAVEPVAREVDNGDIVLGSSPDTSSTYSDFEVDGETGLLVDFAERFTSDTAAASPISERITTGDGAAITVADATIELLTVRVNTGHPGFSVTVEIRNGSEALRLNAEPAPLVEIPLPRPVDTGAAVTSYVDRDGVEHALVDAIGRTDVPAGATTIVMLGFEDAAPGGTITLPVGRAGVLEEVDIRVPHP